MKLKINFDVYLKGQFKDAGFATRFKKAAKAWDQAIKQDIIRYGENNPVNPVHPVKKLFKEGV